MWATDVLQSGDCIVKRLSEFLGCELRVGGNRFTDTDLENVGAEPALLPLFEVAQAPQRNRQNRGMRFACEQSNAGAEGLQRAVVRLMSFGKDEHVIAAVHGLACVGEAAPEARSTRQGKDIEERRDDEVLEGGDKIQQPVAWLRACRQSSSISPAMAMATLRRMDAGSA